MHTERRVLGELGWCGAEEKVRVVASLKGWHWHFQGSCIQCA